ncbi:hypothetical protein A234_18105, partial [Pseudomonas syringae pv. actinidiae ICMP 19101]
RAKRFWESQGFATVCGRKGVAMGLKKNTILTMIKTCDAKTLTNISMLITLCSPAQKVSRSS